jgi:hypothetical protein
MTESIATARKPLFNQIAREERNRIINEMEMHMKRVRTTEYRDEYDRAVGEIKFLTGKLERLK